MSAARGSNYINDWPEESREAAQLVIDKYGEPDEATESRLTWHRRGPWKRIVAQKQFYRHCFPIEHIDSVESFIDYRVPPEKFSELAEFDGSIVVERTAASSRRHTWDLHFTPAREGEARDPDEPQLTSDDLAHAKQQGEQSKTGARQ